MGVVRLRPAAALAALFSLLLLATAAPALAIDAAQLRSVLTREARSAGAFSGAYARDLTSGADLVAIHFHFKYERDTRGFSVVDILRIDGGYIREHWDVIQEVPDPATAKNTNGMF